MATGIDGNNVSHRSQAVVDALVKLQSPYSAYRKLMDHLGDMEMQTRHCGKYIRRAVELVVFSGLVAFLVVSLSVEPTNRQRLLKLRIWQWATMALMVTAIFSVVPFATWLLSQPLLKVFRTSKYWVYYLKRMKRSVDYTLWSCLVLAGWYMWFRPRLRGVYGEVSVIVCQQVTRLLIALCIGFLLWCFKRALYLKLEADLHYDQLFDRIQQTIVFLNGLLILHTIPPPPAQFLSYDPVALQEFTRHGQSYTYWPRRMLRNWCLRLNIQQQQGPPAADGRPPQTVQQHPEAAGQPAGTDQDPPTPCTNIWMDVKRMRRDSVPIWIMVRLCKEYLNAVNSITPPGADALIIDDEKLLQEAKEMFRHITGGSPTQDIQFGKIKRDHLKYGYQLSKKELEYLFETKLPEEGNKNNNGDDENQTNSRQPHYKSIGVDEFLQWAVRAHKNCWGLQRTLSSSKAAFVKLDRMLSSFLLVVVVIIWLLLSKIVNTGQLALLFAPFLAASFMFENSSKNLFQGIIFAFAMHPFDVGDRVIIEDIQMRVKELHILTSVFYKYDTGAEVIFPNSKLATTKIVNLDITPDQSDTLDFIIHDKTPIENIRDLELTIQRLLDDDMYYSSGTKVVKNSPQKPEVPNELKMTVHYKYLVSYLTADKKAARKSEILSKIMRFVKEMETEENKKEYPLDFKPYHFHLTTKKKVVRLPAIHGIKRIILARAKEVFKDAKIMLTHVEEKKIEMGLYAKEIILPAGSNHDDVKFADDINTLLHDYGYVVEKFRVDKGEAKIIEMINPPPDSLRNNALLTQTTTNGKGNTSAATSSATTATQDIHQISEA